MRISFCWKSAFRYHHWQQPQLCLAYRMSKDMGIVRYQEFQLSTSFRGFFFDRHRESSVIETKDYSVRQLLGRKAASLGRILIIPLYGNDKQIKWNSPVFAIPRNRSKLISCNSRSILNGFLSQRYCCRGCSYFLRIPMNTMHFHLLIRGDTNWRAPILYETL